MNVSDCYRILGLRAGASVEDVKASYRRLVRRYHPDVNPHNQEQAKDRFIQLTEAYRTLSQSVCVAPPREPNFAEVRRQSPQAAQSPPSRPRAPSPPEPSSSQASEPRSPHTYSSFESELSEAEQKLKQSAYIQLQQLLKAQRFPRAIALVEGLAQRLPGDLEVRQWQAITYQRWGRQLVTDQKFDKARIYLQKALKVDSRNRSLWAEVQRELRRIEEYQSNPQTAQLGQQ